jgi:excisionase family DNA binding protein
MDVKKTTETLTVQEVREILQLGTNSAYNLIHSKSFPVRKVGHTYRIPVKPFLVWLEGTPSERAANADMKP